MPVYRFLDPFNSKDQKHFELILDHYLEFEKNRQIKLYDYESVVKMVTWFKAAFNQFSQKDFVVCSKFENNEISKILIVYKLKLIFSDNTHFVSDNILPYTSLALMYHKDKKWSNPKEDTNILSKLACDHFEAQGITKMLQILRLSRKILKTPNIEDFLNQEFIETFDSGNRYFLTLEALFFSQQDLDQYRSSLFRGLVPLNIQKPVMIVSWNLKPKYILNSWLENNNDQCN